MAAVYELGRGCLLCMASPYQKDAERFGLEKFRKNALRFSFKDYMGCCAPGKRMSVH